MSENFRTALFADREAGEQAVQFLLSSWRGDLQFLVVNGDDSAVKTAALGSGFDPQRIFTNEQLGREDVQSKFREAKLSVIILAWWPFIVKQPWLGIPEKGIINFHPSFLPYNRGKNYNFWTLVEDSPFGVSLHFIDESIDGGDILFRKTIDKTWEDTGESLYYKARTAMTELFRESYPFIRTGNYTRMKQDLTKGSYHNSKDMEAASRIDLQKTYKARDLLNLLRAKTFPPHPAAWFEEEGQAYEVTIHIKKK